MEYVPIMCERSVIDDIVECKHEMDVAKRRYNDARDTLIEIAEDVCQYSSFYKASGKYLTESHVVIVEPRLKFTIFDYEKTPDFIKPYMKKVEMITLSPNGKVEFDDYLTQKYGGIDYNHARSTEFFNSLGIKSSLILSVTVKPIG